MAQAKRRVSYVIPPPQDPLTVPRLILPSHASSRLGAVGPLLTPVTADNDVPDPVHPSCSRRPCHRLGVASLALDTSTHLVGRSCPEGILYTGGRDGLVISWDLGIPTQQRAQPKKPSDRTSTGKWEFMTGWADDVIGETEDSRLITGGDGDILGDVEWPRKHWSGPRSGEIPYEKQWEMNSIATEPGFVRLFWIQGFLMLKASSRSAVISDNVLKLT